MAVSRGAQWFDVARGSLAAIVLAIAGFTTDRAGAEIIKKEDTLAGITMTREQCAAKPQTVWLTVYGQDLCVRYYLSTAGGEGTRPVVFLNGDYNGPISLTRDGRGNITRTWSDPSRAQDLDTDNLAAMADSLSKSAKTTVVYIGRIGVEGTSGNHFSRKTALELQLMNLALNAIKQRHGFEGFHLAGESGGGRLVFGLAAMRNDVRCVISGSGQLATKMGMSQLNDPGKTYFDVMETLPTLARNGALRPMVITDRADQQVPVEDQTALVNRMRSVGRQIPQFFVEAVDVKHHAVVEYVGLAMSACVLDRSDADLARAFDTVIRRNAEINQLRQDSTRTNTALGAAGRQPGRS